MVKNHNGSQGLTEARKKIIAEMNKREDQVIDICSKLVKINTVNPPSDTKEIAELIGDMLIEVGAEVSYYTKEDPIKNIVAKIKGKGPGKRLIFNGHLDTFPIGDIDEWTVNPFGAVQKDGRLYGRGVSDMKGGVSSSIFAFMLMAEFKEYWSGEIVLVLVGDEESGGVKGTQYLLEHISDAVGDVMIKGDAGSPMVLRFGEKGVFWLELHALGKASHGAHLHKGDNAIEKLIKGLEGIKAALLKIPVTAPTEITKAVIDSSEISEKYSGQGESEVLQTVTINFGVIEGGISPNLVPDKASAKLDIRMPAGVTSQQVKEKLDEVVDAIPGLTYKVLQKHEPNWTDIKHEIFPLIAANGYEVMKEQPVITMRVGASDARMYRENGIPSVNCGLTPFNMGAADEYILVDELKDVAKIHTLTAFDYLTKERLAGGEI